MEYTDPYIELCFNSPESVFNLLTQQERELLEKNNKIIRLDKGQQLLTEGARQKDLVFLISGLVKVYLTGVGGREQIIKIIKPFGIVDYSIFFSPGKNPVNASSLNKSAVLMISKRIIREIMGINNRFSNEIVRLAAEELTSAYNRLVSLTQKHTRGRIAESLLIIIETCGLEDDGKTINGTFSRDDIAHLSSMITSNAIRTLSDFAAEGIIEINGKKIRIRDKYALEKISMHG